MATKEPLATSSHRASVSSVENSPGEETWPPGRASLAARIVQFVRSPQGLVVLCICWPLLLLAAVFVSILLT